MKLLSLFLRSISDLLKLKKLYKKDNVFIFYAETELDWTFLNPVYYFFKNNFDNRLIKVCSDQNDKNLNDSESFYVGYGISRTIFFSNLKAKIIIMTLTDLDNFHLKKSIYKVHYIYVFHSIASVCRVYNEKAFNAYDTFLCSGKHQLEELQKIKNLYNLKNKYFIKYGYPKLDTILKKIPKNKKTIKQTILIAPTWGASSISFKTLQKMINNLTKKYNVILRLHTMTLRKNKYEIAKIVSLFDSNKNFIYDRSNSLLDSFVHSDFLITEWSGAAFEFAFSKLKPVIFINTEQKTNNKNWKLINKRCFEEFSRSKIGKIINENELYIINKTLISFQANEVKWKEKIKVFRNNYIYNVGESNEIGGNFLLKHISSLVNEKKINLCRDGR